MAHTHEWYEADRRKVGKVTYVYYECLSCPATKSEIIHE